MSDFINTIDALGDDVVTDSFITRTITEFKDNVITVVGSYAFNSCKYLLAVDLPSVTTIKIGAFSSCTSLKSLILRNETMCTLGNPNAFTSSAIHGGTGYIYVPASLIEDYKVATNWSTYAGQFRALEDYTVDGTVTGELDESKI